MTCSYYRRAAGALALLLVAACATPPQETPGKVVDRLPEGTLKAPPPALPKLTLDDVARLAREGISAEGITARLKESATRLRLSASDVVSLRARNVPLPVIDHLLDADRQAGFDECSERINRLESDHAKAVKQFEQVCWQRCNLACPPWPHSYYPWRRWP